MQDGDTIEIDIPGRSTNLLIDEADMDQRRAAIEALPQGQAWQPKGGRTRIITRSLKAYAAFATSADRGGFRDL